MKPTKNSLKALEELNDVSAVWLLMTVEQSAAVGHTPYRSPDRVLYSRIKKTKKNFRPSNIPSFICLPCCKFL
jgi:hypothetical protein